MRDTLLLFICAVALLFSACSKQKPLTPEEELVKVTFKVNSFSHDIEPMAGIQPSGTKIAANASGRKLSDAINHLLFYTFNEQGNQIQSVVQHSHYPDFGKVADFLNKGKYTVLVLGRKQPFFDQFFDYNDYNGFYSRELRDEVFFKKIDLVVSDSEVEQDIVLERKGGMVEIDITGDIPLNIGEIRYSISGVSDFFIPKTNRGNNNQGFTRSTLYENDGTPYTWDGGEMYRFYFFLHEDRETKATVKLAAYNRSNELVAVKVIEDVPVAVNRKTTLRGRLFETTGNITTQSFSVSY